MRYCKSLCPFCSPNPTCKLIENDLAIAVQDAYPVVDGHTLVIPRKHVASIYELSAEEQTAVWSLVAEVRDRLLTGLKPDGFNIGVNDGLAAGQTIEHAHVHVIPRRKGDVPDPRGGIRWVIDVCGKKKDSGVHRLRTLPRHLAFRHRGGIAR